MIALFLALVGCATTAPTPPPPADATEGAPSTEPATPAEPGAAVGAAFSLSSTSFEAGGAIPRRLTCEGEDTSPALAWSNVPEGTQSLALIVADPDAPDPERPRMTWVHWVVYDIPPAVTGLAEGAATTGMPEGSRQGSNDFRNTGYGGPCPPIGTHRYVHSLYALDTVLGDLGALARVPLGKAMEGHLLGEAELIGTYRKTAPGGPPPE